MKKGISRGYYVIPVLYVILIGALIYLHFESGIRFEKKMRGYTLSGEYERGKKERIRFINVNFGNFSLKFSNKNPLKIKIRENNLNQEIILEPISYNTRGEKETSITFETRKKINGSRVKTLIEITNSEGKNLYVKPIFNQNLKLNTNRKKTKTLPVILTIPFETHTNEINVIKQFPISSFKGKCITLPYGSYIHYKPNEIGLKIDENTTNNAIHIFSKPIGEKNLYLLYLTDRLNLKTENSNIKLKEKINAYIDKAFSGWSKRFDRERNKWKVNTKNYTFDERIEAAVVSEALQRNKIDLIRTYLTALRVAMRENPSVPLPYITSPYFGGLKKFIAEKHQRSKDFSNSIRKEIKQLKTNFLKKPDLVIYLLDMAPYSLLEETTKYVDSLEMDQLNTETAVYLLNYYAELIKYVGYKKIHLDRINTLIDEKILPAITILKQRNIQIKTEERTDPYLSLLTGIDMILIKGLSPVKQQIGKLLINSTLNLSDEMGVIQRIYPEEIYPLLCRVTPRYYPKEIPMFKVSKPGEWLWTASELKGISFRNKALEIKLQYPPKESHFILIQGVRKPIEVVLHNTTWRPDKFYYNYRDGWFYEERTQSLFIKYTNREKIETIRILF